MAVDSQRLIDAFCVSSRHSSVPSSMSNGSNIQMDTLKARHLRYRCWWCYICNQSAHRLTLAWIRRLRLELFVRNDYWVKFFSTAIYLIYPSLVSFSQRGYLTCFCSLYAAFQLPSFMLNIRNVHHEPGISRYRCWWSYVRIARCQLGIDLDEKKV